jgi:hypothetical protein
MTPQVTTGSQKRLPEYARQLAISTALILGVRAFTSTAAASTATPPDPNTSCASAEYASHAGQRPQQSTSSSGDSPALVVVSGRAPVNTTRQVKLGQQVTVCIMGLYDWIYKQKKSPSTLRLFVGGYILSKVSPSSVSPSSQEYLNFVPQMETADSDDWKAWAAIVDASRHSQNNDLPISVAVADTKQVFESNVVVSVDPYPRRWPYLLGLFVLLLAALVYLARKTDLLRYAVATRPSSPLRPPFSLGLVQMAFWFYLALAAYVYILVSTRQIHIPMGSVLGLLGISSTTGLAAIAVDRQKNTAAQDQRGKLVAEQASLTARVNDLASSNPVVGSAQETELRERRARLAEVASLLAQLPTAPAPAASKGFLQDILNDGDGVSFHRFQIAIWTIVLGSVFVWSVYRNISMPEFDASLLTLMGISAGTYVGFKFPEKPKT